MKSFCVLNSRLSAAAGESIGKAAVKVLGRKIGVFSREKNPCVKSIARGIKKAGGCAVAFENCFESQLCFAALHFDLDGMFFVGNNNLISVYNSSASAVTALQEDELSQLAAQNSLPDERGGEIISATLDDVYYKSLMNFSHSFENINVNIKCSDSSVAAVLKRVLYALGGSEGGKITFSLSSSGLVLSAVDETGRIHSHSVLYDACAACEVESGKDIEVPFFSSSQLEKFSEKSGAKIIRSFAGGNEIWQKDAVFLSARLMYHMAKCGCGLATLCNKLPATSVRRKNFSSSFTLSDIADVIECEEVVTDINGGVFAKSKQGNMLVTACSRAGKYCLEVQAADVETAQELAAVFTKAVCLT